MSVVSVKSDNPRAFINKIIGFADPLTRFNIQALEFRFSDGTIKLLGDIPANAVISSIDMPTGTHSLGYNYYADVTVGPDGKYIRTSPQYFLNFSTYRYPSDTTTAGAVKSEIDNYARWPKMPNYVASTGSRRNPPGQVLAGFTAILSDNTDYIYKKWQFTDLVWVTDPTKQEFGTWSDWSPWSECNTSISQIRRTRTCTPTITGAGCEGVNIETAPCPPKDGYFGEWSNWTDCNAKCGTEGRMYRTRPYFAAQYGGKDLSDPRMEEKTCMGPPCPIDGQFSEWSAWSVCDAQCGAEGKIKRTRTYTPAQNGGQELVGPLEEVIGCKGDPCPVIPQPTIPEVTQALSLVDKSPEQPSPVIQEQPSPVIQEQPSVTTTDLQNPDTSNINAPVVADLSTSDPNNTIQNTQSANIFVYLLILVAIALGISVYIYKRRQALNQTVRTDTTPVIQQTT